MEAQGRQRATGGAAPAAAGGGDGGGDAAAQPFRIPDGYFEHYLAGKPEGPEPDYPAIRAAGQSGTLLDEHGPGFEQAYGEWLYHELKLADFLAAHDRPAPAEERRPLLAELAALAPADRRILRQVVTARGDDERLTKALGPAALSYLADAPPPPPTDEPRDEKEEAAGDAPHKESEDEEEAKGDEKAPESKGRFEGGTRFDQLFGAVMERKQAPAPAPILAQVAALDERVWSELSSVIDEKNAWLILEQALGPPFAEAVTALRWAPLARLLAQHGDGVCPVGERQQTLSALQALGPFEKRHLVTFIVDGGHGRPLLTLLGAELGEWLGGDFANAPPPEEEKIEPPAALAALRHLPPPILRRLLSELRQRAAGPRLLAALDDQVTAFVEAYFAGVERPDPTVKHEPKPALEALRQVDPAEVQRLIPDAEPGDGEHEDPGELAADAGATQYDALFKPLLTSKTPKPDQLQKTLEALGKMSLRELEALLDEVQPDDRPRLEAALGPELRRMVADALHAPLAEALETHPLDEELAEEVRAQLLAPLIGLSDFARSCLEERITEEKSAERLAALLGPALARDTGLQIDAAVAPPPPPELAIVLPAAQRKSALDALRRLSPTLFAPLMRDCKPETLFRFATTAAGGLDVELGQALLKLVPPVDPGPPDPQRAAAEAVELQTFFDALVAQQQARAGEPLPRPNLPPESQRKKKRTEDEDLHDGFDVETIYRQLMSKFLEGDEGERELGDPERAHTLSAFAALPVRVRHALVRHMENEGTWESLSAELGPELSRAASDEA